jgi:hypothetical protein
MSWDIKPGSENEFFEFIMRDFAPGIHRLGLKVTEIWYTIHGDGPQMFLGAVTEDLPEMNEVIHSNEWHELQGKLQAFVTNFRQKIVQAKTRFQIF